MPSQHEIGPATLLVLPEHSGHLDTDDLLVPGGGRADVFVDEDGDTLVQVGPEPVSSEQLVQAVLRSPAFSPRGDAVDIAVVGERGHDRWSFSSDGRHQLLHQRVWQDRDGPSLVVVGLAPLEEQRGRGVIADAMSLVTAARSTPSSVALVHVLTERVASLDQVTGTTGERGDDGGRRATSLAEADLALAAWGAVPAAGDWAVESVLEDLRAAHEVDVEVLVPGRDGDPLTAGDPPQPSANLGAAGVTLVPAPSDWLWGAPLS